LTWFLIAVGLHFFAPYDIEGAAASGGAAAATSWLVSRFLLNFGVAFAYYAFFYVGLYIFHLGDRKYKPGYYPKFANMAHNLWYWTLGVVQWTFLEYVMCRAWAEGFAASFASNAEVRITPQ